jgi:hypothetical protein
LNIIDNILIVCLKIVLLNLQTGDETIFPCKDILIRDDSNFRAEKTFEIQPDESDDESKLESFFSLIEYHFDLYYNELFE